MRFLKRNTRPKARISLILLDWSVRDSFHILHYLGKQIVSRDLFEVVIVEYYSNASTAIQRFEDQIDTWVLLEMPEVCYYHKHLMYNVGILLSQGEICVICDSDAMVKDTFLSSILDAFAEKNRLVLHMDQFRNVRCDMYPFNYPSFEEVLGDGCINRANGMTTGLADMEDTIHTRNYGACMCARRSDLIAIGGADEHIDYLGHICGPYEMTFRLVNYGCREAWHKTEFLYHTWHPGSDGIDNYLGPCDGRNMSLTALEAIASGRIVPYQENPAIWHLRNGESFHNKALLDLLIDPTSLFHWDRRNLKSTWMKTKLSLAEIGYKGHNLPKAGATYHERGDNHVATCEVSREGGGTEGNYFQRECRDTVRTSIHNEVAQSEAKIREQNPVGRNILVGRYKGFRIFKGHNGYCARLLVFQSPAILDSALSQPEFSGGHLEEVLEQIDHAVPFQISLANASFKIVGLLWGLMDKCAQGASIRPHRFRTSVSAPGSAGGAKPQAAIRTKELGAQVRQVWLQIVSIYVNFLLSMNSGLLQVRDLIVNLYLLKHSVSLHERLNTATVITSSSLARYYVLVLSRLRILPKVNVTIVTKTNELTKFLADLERKGNKAAIVMTQSEYVKYRTLLVSSPNRNNILCV